MIKKSTRKIAEKQPTKRSNPIDSDLIKKIHIRKMKDGDLIIYRVYSGVSEIGYFEIYQGDNFINLADIAPNFRRKGIATYIYDYIENDLGIKLRPSDLQLESHSAFWKNRLKTRKNPKCRTIEVKRKIKILGKPRVVKVKRKICNPGLDLARLERSLVHELIEYDRKLTAKDRNIYRMGHYLKAVEKAFGDLKQIDDPTLQDVKESISQRFDPQLPPVKKFLKKYT